MSLGRLSIDRHPMKLPVGRLLYVIDVLAWMLAMLVAAVLRYEFDFNEISWNAYVGFVAGAAGLQLLFGLIFHLYRKGMRFRAGGFEDTLAVSLAAGVVGSILWIVSLVFGGAWEISRGIMLIATPGALILMLGTRFAARLIVRSSRKPGPDSSPALILGGGYRASNPKAMLPGEHEMPSGDEIGEEFERFLAALDATEEDNRTEEVGGPAELPEADPGDEFPDDE